MSDKNSLENMLERGLFASRWIIAPMYVGLAMALLMLTVIFLRELAYYVPQMMTLSPEKAILVVLIVRDWKAGRLSPPYPVLLAAYLLLCVGWYLLTRTPERAVAFFRRLRGERVPVPVTRSPE